MEVGATEFAKNDREKKKLTLKIGKQESKKSHKWKM